MSKKTLLFAHGWATDHRVWDPYIERLLSSGEPYEVVNPDLPGHGKVSVDRYEEGGLNCGIDKFSEILENIRIQDPQLAPIAIGWSLGALLLMKMELLRPGSFSGLVLVGATPSFVSRVGFPHGQKRAIVRKMMADLKKEPQEALERFYGLNFTDTELAGPEAKAFLGKFSGAEADTRPESLSNALEALYNTDIIDEIDSLDLPVLILHGAQDNVAPMGAASFLARKIRGARLHIFEDLGHAPFLTDPGSFFQITGDFFSEILD